MMHLTWKTPRTVAVAARAVLLVACEDGATAPAPGGSASGGAAGDGLAVGADKSGAATDSFVIVRRDVVRGGGARIRSTRSGTDLPFVCTDPEDCHEQCPGAAQEGWTTVCSCLTLGDQFV